MRVHPTCLLGCAKRGVCIRANLCVAPSVPVPLALCFVLCCTLLPATVVARVVLSLCSLRAARRCTRARVGAWRRCTVAASYCGSGMQWRSDAVKNGGRDAHREPRVATTMQCDDAGLRSGDRSPLPRLLGRMNNASRLGNVFGREEVMYHSMKRRSNTHPWTLHGKACMMRHARVSETALRR